MAVFPYESAPAHRVTELNLKKNISDMHSSCLRDNLNQFTVKKKKNFAVLSCIDKHIASFVACSGAGLLRGEDIPRTCFCDRQ